MNYLPKDILEYIYSNELEADFMVSNTRHVGDYSIAEITDAVFKRKEEGFWLHSDTYKLNLMIEDEQIVTALLNNMYVSAFISRYKDDFEVHFLVHQYPQHMKQQFDEAILEEVIRYMILKTVLRLRLDTPDKVDSYLGRKVH